MYYICLLTDDTYIIEIMIIVTVKNISIYQQQIIALFAGKRFRQVTNTPLPSTDIIMYMMIHGQCNL